MPPDRAGPLAARKAAQITVYLFVSSIHGR
jgi:hypothetical protein